MRAQLPGDESARLEALHDYAILDTVAEQAYDDLTRIASHIAGTPIALISLVDSDRQWFKSRMGLAAQQTPREYAFCAHAILEPDRTMVVTDARNDARFAGNPLVTGAPDIRFYAGAPLLTPDHQALGTLCVIDCVPREPDEKTIEMLGALSRQVMTQLELRRSGRQLRAALQASEAYLERIEKQNNELQLANLRLQELSLTDKLTGVGNRAAFDQKLGEELGRAARHGTPLSLLLIDVDHFKQFNDAFGHPAGDVALQRVAAALRCDRPGDFLARYGGEEFAVSLPATDEPGAWVIAQRLRESVAALKLPARELRVSIGVATLASGTTDSQGLVAQADAALYAAKDQGRNRVVHASTIAG